MWPGWSHKLAPLTKLSSIEKKFKWTQVKQDAFDEIARIVARDTLLTYTDLMKHLKFIPMLMRPN